MINGKYRTETRHNGKKIIIDLAEVPADFGGPFEVIAMYPGGLDIEIANYSDFGEAVAAYNAMRNKYADNSPAPLHGRYKTFKDHLWIALFEGVQAENGDDNGTSNFDSVAVYLPRWREKLVMQAAEEAGTHCTKYHDCTGTYYVIAPTTNAQGRRRTQNAKAIRETLEYFGYDTMVHYRAD